MTKSGKSTRQSRSLSKGREKWVVAACVAGFMVFLALFGTVAGMITQRAGLNKQLLQWRAAYHLTDQQAARIREIELKFHGNGNPFTSRDSGTPEENDAHHLEISRVMNPEDGARFVKVMIKNGGQH
jgi:hypothetical protein